MTDKRFIERQAKELDSLFVDLERDDLPKNTKTKGYIISYRKKTLERVIKLLKEINEMTRFCKVVVVRCNGKEEIAIEAKRTKKD